MSFFEYFRIIKEEKQDSLSEGADERMSGTHLPPLEAAIPSRTDKGQGRIIPDMLP